MDKKTKLKYFYYNRFAHPLYDFVNKIKKNIYFKSVPIHNNEDYTPFFIVGSGRSGNTLLRRILNSRQGIVIPPETYVLGRILRLHNTHKNLKWDDYVNLVISTIEYHPEFYTFEIDSLRSLALELKEIPKEERSLANILNQFYLFYAKKKNLRIIKWGDKTPINSMYIYRLKKLFPNAQFIHIIRNGIDVAYSYVNNGLIDNYETAALRWKKSVSHLQKFGNKYPEEYCELKYEELVTDTEKSVKMICGFLNIEYDDGMLEKKEKVENLGDVKYLDHHQNVFNNINTNSIGKGKENIDENDLQRIKKLTNSLNKSLGY